MNILQSINPHCLGPPAWRLWQGGPKLATDRSISLHATSTPNGPEPSPISGKRDASAPWKLMGRVVREGGVAFDDHVQQGLIMSAAAQASKLKLEDFEIRLQRLLVIMPFLQARLVRMRPALLAALAEDVDRTAQRMISLRDTLPGADIVAIVSQRPTLLLEEEHARLPEVLTALRKHYDDPTIADMVTKEPLLLVEDIDKVLIELERWELEQKEIQAASSTRCFVWPNNNNKFVPGRDHVAALRANPSLASQVANLQNLSLWLIPQPPSAVLDILRKDPSMVHSVARGTQALGPGAEYLGGSGA